MHRDERSLFFHRGKPAASAANRTCGISFSAAAVSCAKAWSLWTQNLGTPRFLHIAMPGRTDYSPCADSRRSISREVSTSGLPSSMAGNIWLCKSISASLRVRILSVLSCHWIFSVFLYLGFRFLFGRWYPFSQKRKMPFI